jgi:hypothetical protein
MFPAIMTLLGLAIPKETQCSATPRNLVRRILLLCGRVSGSSRCGARVRK